MDNQTNTYINNLRHKDVRALNVGPRQLLPEYLDLVENGQRVDGRRGVLDRFVHRLQFVQLDRPVNSHQRLVHGNVQPVRDARGEPPMVLVNRKVRLPRTERWPQGGESFQHQIQLEKGCSHVDVFVLFNDGIV